MSDQMLDFVETVGHWVGKKGKKKSEQSRILTPCVLPISELRNESIQELGLRDDWSSIMTGRSRGSVFSCPWTVVYQTRQAPGGPGLPLSDPYVLLGFTGPSVSGILVCRINN